jgi:hypothetical protein
MTIACEAPANETLEQGIIFPEGEFWIDESPLETHLHLQGN